MKKEYQEQLKAIQAKKSVEISDEQKLVSLCDHSWDNGKSSLRPYDRSRDLYHCQICKKNVSLKPISQNDLKDAVDTIDAAIDAIKISSVTFSSSTREQFGKVSAVLGSIPKLYAQATSEPAESKDYSRQINNAPKGFQSLFGGGNLPNMASAGRSNNNQNRNNRSYV